MSEYDSDRASAELSDISLGILITLYAPLCSRARHMVRDCGLSAAAATELSDTYVKFATYVAIKRQRSHASPVNRPIAALNWLRVE